MKTHSNPKHAPAPSSAHDALRAALGPGLQLAGPTGSVLNVAVNSARTNPSGIRY